MECVIIHTPGPEVENMNPQNAERALYSDVLNLDVLRQEYQQFKEVLDSQCKTLQIGDLLHDILQSDNIRCSLIKEIVELEKSDIHIDSELDISPDRMAKALIHGVIMQKDNLTKYFNDERYALRPLHNFFFTRDAATTIGKQVLINPMANQVRARESLIMEYIFNYHPKLKTVTINPSRLNKNPQVTIEGGDILIARADTLIIGTGVRTSVQGVDFILETVRNTDQIKHIVVQELPAVPESYIHLDMVFTLLDRDTCMIFEPVVLTPNNYRTIHINIDGEKVNISSEKDLPTVLEKLGFDLKPVFCGGNQDKWIQEREQWHSGANFFAFAPGKLIGYNRNINTLEQLNQSGFEIIPSEKVICGEVDPKSYAKCVVTIDGSELARGGGGARCMTMPFRRKAMF